MVVRTLLGVGFWIFFTQNVAYASPSEFKGFFAVESMLQEKIFASTPKFRLLSYIGSNDLLSLLGTYNVGPGGHSQFQNGTPNPTNMLLWHLTMSGVAEDISRSCSNPNNISFKPEFSELLKSLCQWPKPVARDPAVLLDFWFFLMGYESDEQEFEAWRDFFLQGPYSESSAQETVSAMALSVFLNPYFLLK